MFDTVVREVGQRRVLYFEFGVAFGSSFRYWAGKLAHPKSKLYGFDSFVGPPEDFDLLGKARRGAFNQKDNLPRVADERVHLVKGWFDEIFPGFTLDPHGILVINCDANLYSSTKTVLKYLTPHITAGTYIYFDDMERPDHEPKAFREFMRDTGLRFEAIAADMTCNAMFFRCTGKPAVAGQS